MVSSLGHAGTAMLRRAAYGMTLGMRRAIRSGFEPGEEGWGQAVGSWKAKQGVWALLAGDGGHAARRDDEIRMGLDSGGGRVTAGGREGSGAPGVFKDRSLRLWRLTIYEGEQRCFRRGSGSGGITEWGTPQGWKLKECCRRFQLLIHSSPALFCVLL